MIEYI